MLCHQVKGDAASPGEMWCCLTGWNVMLRHPVKCDAVSPGERWCCVTRWKVMLCHQVKGDAVSPGERWCCVTRWKVMLCHQVKGDAVSLGERWCCVTRLVVADVLKRLSAFVFKDRGVQKYKPEEPFFMDLLQMKERSPEILGDTNPKTPCHILEDTSPQIHCSRNFQISYTVVCYWRLEMWRIAGISVFPQLKEKLQQHLKCIN